MSSQQRRLRPPCLVAELSLSSQLRRLKDLGPTVQRLARLQGSINRECFSCSRPDHSANPNLSSVTIEIALYLSSPLVQWSGADSSAFREVQLRALVAAFALLHHIGVTKLSADLYDKLRSNVAGRFSDIIDGRRDSQTSLEGRMKEAHALYLIRLVAQYFFLFKRAQPHVQALSKPILGLALAGVSIVSLLCLCCWSPLTLARLAGNTTLCKQYSITRTSSSV